MIPQSQNFRPREERRETPRKMRNIKKLALEKTDSIVINVEQEIQITIRNGGATSDDVQQLSSSPFPAATYLDSTLKTNQVPALDSTSGPLSLPSTPTLLTEPPNPSSIRNCGSCTRFNDRGIMRICKPCYDLDSIPAISATGAEGIIYAEPVFASPGVLAVILVLLFLVAVALVDLSEWVWDKLHRRSLILPECEKGEIFLEELDDSYDSDEDERLIP